MAGILEVCVDSLASARAAIKGGADRLELCSALAVGGLTPYTELLRQIRQKSDIPVRCLMRPRAGDFLYTEEEIQEILKELSDNDDCGIILRAKGIVPCTDGTWLHFDMVPEEYELRHGDADYTGRICVIGSMLDKEELAKLFHL